MHHSSSSTQTIAVPPQIFIKRPTFVRKVGLVPGPPPLSTTTAPVEDCNNKIDAFCQTVLNAQPNKPPTINPHKPLLQHIPHYGRKKHKKYVDSSTNTPRAKVISSGTSTPVFFHQEPRKKSTIFTNSECSSAGTAPNSGHLNALLSHGHYRSASAAASHYCYTSASGGHVQVDGLAFLPSRFGVYPRLTVTAPRKLNEKVEAKLAREISELNRVLLPSQEDLRRRWQCCKKVEAIVQAAFGSKEISARLFGSSVNGLCTPQSDADILLDSPDAGDPHGSKSLANMHALAQVLKRAGMTNVLPVAEARVPICKFDDPEFGLKCDINVNSSAAIRNTLLIQKYVELDPRVRQLLLLVKHWAKERLLNDAKGGTLSSYCWSMIVLSFLQTREPPVIPSLHSIYYDKLAGSHNDTEAAAIPTRVVINGLDCSFYDDLKSLDFRSDNNDTAASLFYQFFHFMALEFDYDTQVMSVRSGSVLSKISKDWTSIVKGQFNYLCVEEPFVISRNLANNVDAISAEGLIREFGRALAILSGHTQTSPSALAWDAIDISLVSQVCERWQPPVQKQFNLFGAAQYHLAAPHSVTYGRDTGTQPPKLLTMPFLPAQTAPLSYSTPAGADFGLAKRQRDCGKVGKVIELASSIKNLRPVKSAKSCVFPDPERRKSSLSTPPTPSESSNSPDQYSPKDKREENAIRWKSFRDNERSTHKTTPSEQPSDKSSDSFSQDSESSPLLASANPKIMKQRRPNINYGREYATYLSNSVSIPSTPLVVAAESPAKAGSTEPAAVGEQEVVGALLKSCTAKSDSAVDLPNDVAENLGNLFEKALNLNSAVASTCRESTIILAKQKTWADIIRAQR